jgi:hypothetical protein
MHRQIFRRRTKRVFNTAMSTHAASRWTVNRVWTPAGFDPGIRLYALSAKRAAKYQWTKKSSA